VQLNALQTKGKKSMKKKLRLLAFVMFATALCWDAPVSSAQDMGDFTPPLQIKNSVNAGMSLRSETDIDEGGKFDAWGFQVGGASTIKISEDLLTSIGGNYEYNSYNFSDVADEPWEDINTIRLHALFNYTVDETWSVLGGPILIVSGEQDADTGDSTTGGAIAGARYIVHEDLTLGLVVGILSQIEDDTGLVAFPLVDWQISDPWSLKLGFTDLGSKGAPGLEISYKANDEWQFAGGIQMQTRRFRLDDEGSNPDGVGEDTSTPIYAKATYNVSSTCSVNGYVGVTAGGSLRVEDEDGDKLSEEDYDPSAQFGARFVCVF